MIKQQQIKKDSLAAAKIRFWGELRSLGLSQDKKVRLLSDFEKWFNESLDYDMAANRVLETIMAMKSMPTFKEVLNSLGDKDKISWERLLDKDSIEKLFGLLSNKQKLVNFIDKMFNEGKHENEITNAIILEAREQMGDKLDSVGIDKVRLWVLEEKVKLNIGNKNG
jgi:isocitrate dehydrogenase kinase/phosphatase